MGQARQTKKSADRLTFLHWNVPMREGKSIGTFISLFFVEMVYDGNERCGILRHNDLNRRHPNIKRQHVGTAVCPR